MAGLNWMRGHWRQANELPKPAKSDMEPVSMAARARWETTMTFKWLGEHSAMGHWTTAANLLAAESKRK